MGEEDWLGIGLGETAHEWLGLSMFLLFVLHHLLLIVMLLQPVSGILMSKHIFHFSSAGGMSLARTIHLLLSHWGFILMSIHVGNHVGVHRAGKKKGAAVILWMAVIAVSIYGACAFVNRDMASYLFLKNQFVFFDFEQSRLHFLADYVSMMCLFACISAAFSKGLKMLKRSKRGISKNE